METRLIPLSDSIQLAAKIWRGGPKTPVICLHGLTRNAADFEDLQPLIAAVGHDSCAITMRGRGKSDRDPNYSNYHPLQYRDDVISVMNSMAIERAVFIGTSLGGIVTMLVNEAAPELLAGAIINDVGPDLAPEGIARIAGYVGKTSGVAADLDGAAAAIRAVNETAFPDRPHEFWVEFAKRTFRQNPDGSWALDYDPNIGRALTELGPAPDLWGPWEGLKSKPTLVIRGAISDLLSPQIVEKMRGVHPNFDYAEVANTGHAPTLTEPEAWRAIEAFLARIG